IAQRGKRFQVANLDHTHYQVLRSADNSQYSTECQNLANAAVGRPDRLMDAAGYARIGLVEEKVDLHYNDVPALLQGAPQDDKLPQWKEIVARKEFSITLNLNLGSAQFDLLSTDLSTGYVDFNKSE
ncbi:MAG: bifunctional ornithine acetyltransferase/N-acetylglutamate synthase, partial [Puniceicoccales bacterium]